MGGSQQTNLVLEAAIQTHVVGGLFIATPATRDLSFLFSARARGRLLAQDGCNRARAENKKPGTWACAYYKQATRDAGLCLSLDHPRFQSIGLNMNRSS